MSRLPVRLRLTLAFAAAMAIVLAATGFFLYARLGSQLDTTLDDGLRARAETLAAAVRGSRSTLRDTGTRLTERGENFAQLLELDGRVLDTTAPLPRRPLLTGPELERAARAPITLDRPPLPGDDDPVRLLAAPVDAHGRRLVVVVGTTLGGRDDALGGLLAQLVVGGPIALALASLLGYLLARAALRPVESMRAEAETISAVEPGRRLPVPETRDEVARLGTTLNEMLGRLEGAVARERSFLADASHELRTPLATLKAELELALREGRTREELAAAVRSAAEETERLTKLSEDLLVLARADQGRLPVRARRVRAEELVDQFAGVPADVPPDLELVADPARIEQALGILLDNARRYGGPQVQLRLLERDDRIEIHVLDRGPGFPAAFLPHAFDRFSRADDARAGGGTGIGLAIARAIARAHRGDAHAANRDGGGADVWLSLPRSHAHLTRLV